MRDGLTQVGRLWHLESMKRISILALIFACACVALVGCAAVSLGKPYEPVENVPSSMGLIYIYAGDAKSLQDVAIDADAEADGITHMISMMKDGYYPFLTTPGLVRILTGPKDEAHCVMLEVYGGSSQYVRITQEHPGVEVLTREEAEPEVSGHRRINSEHLRKSSGVWTAPNCPIRTDVVQ